MAESGRGSSENALSLDVTGPSPATLVEGYTFEAFRVDLAHRQLFRDGQPLALGLKPFDTLVLLIRHRDRVVGKEEIISAVWPDSFVSEDSLTQNVSALRRALCDDPSQPKFIATVARRGYRFIAPVLEVRAEPPPSPVVVTRVPAEPLAESPAVVPASVSRAAAMPGPMPVLSPTPVVVERHRGRERRLAWVAAAVVAVLLLAGVWVRFGASSSAPTGSPLHFTLDLPPGVTLASGGLLSPDSRYLVFVAQDDNSGQTRLWLRSLDAPGSRALEGTEGALRPFWSPDSQAIGFFAGSKVKRIGLMSGPPQTLAPIVGARPSGGTWNSNDVILYGESGSLFSVPAAGGASTLVRVADPAAQEVSLRAPQFLPDGRHFLYVADSPNLENGGTYVGALDSAEKIQVLDASVSSATFAPPGYLAYVRERALMAQRFDLSRFAVTGDPRTLAGSVSANPVISASTAGLFAFGGGTTAERLQWFDRSGERVGVVNVPTVLHNLELSPDQKQVLGSSGEPGQSGVWLVDLDRGAASRLVPSAGPASWSADGAQIVFAAAGYSGAAGIHMRSMVGRPDDALWLSTSDPKVVNDWSGDDQYVVYISGTLRNKNDIWLLPRFGDRKPVPFLQTPANEIQAQVSPDGRWMAYTSDESGTPEIYVQSFPVPGAKRTISVSGGTEPQWRRDGKELFYLSPDHIMMAVEISAGTTLQVSKPNRLFRAPILGSLSDFRSYYAVTADGQRFLIDSVSPDVIQEPITVLVNWTGLVR